MTTSAQLGPLPTYVFVDCDPEFYDDEATRHSVRTAVSTAKTIRTTEAEPALRLSLGATRALLCAMQPSARPSPSMDLLLQTIPLFRRIILARGIKTAEFAAFSVLSYWMTSNAPESKLVIPWDNTSYWQFTGMFPVLKPRVVEPLITVKMSLTELRDLDIGRDIANVGATPEALDFDAPSFVEVVANLPWKLLRYQEHLSAR